MPFFRIAVAGLIIFFGISTSFADTPAAPPRKDKIRILAWGSNDASQLGSQLEDSHAVTTVWATEVEKILEPDFDILDIQGGVYTACLLRSDRTVWCWGGGNTHNQGKKPPGYPHKIADMPPIRALHMGAGYQHHAVSMYGTLWHWGREDWQGEPFAPKWNYVGSDSEQEKTFLSLGRYELGMGNTCGISEEGKLYCRGEPDYGQLVEIPLSQAVIDVKPGKHQTCALLADSSVSCWADSRKPVPKTIFPTGQKFTALTQAWQHACALKEDRTIWCWQALGWSKEVEPKPPYQITTAAGKPLENIRKLPNAGSSNLCALQEGGAVWCFLPGNNDPEMNSYGKVRGAERLKTPDAVCNLGFASDVAVGNNFGFAVVRGTAEDFEKLENECIPD